MKKLLSKVALTVLLSAACTSNILAQEQKASPLDTLTEFVSKLSADVSPLKKIKFAGYVQPQFQWADSNGIKSFAGGDFGPFVDKRFKVRRAEFKTMYETSNVQIVANIDITQGDVHIKDAFGKVTDPWIKTFSLQAGIFNRPFGFEVPYSSGMLESPERARINQVLFPGERDCGAMIIFQLPKTSALHGIKLEAGLFNGTGNRADAFQSMKDFIGHLTYSHTTKNEKIKFGIGASLYSGYLRQNTNVVYTVGALANGNLGWVANDTSSVAAGTDKYPFAGKFAPRQYVGFDAQISMDLPIGMTTLRAEYVTGFQPGTLASSKSPDQTSVAPAGATYIRQFNGAVFYFVQGIWKTKHELLVKYDWYDPNTKVVGDQIGMAGTGLTNTEVMYTTLALGWTYKLNQNVKFVGYYDMVTNETSKNLSGFTRVNKGNVFTLRVQYKF